MAEPKFLTWQEVLDRQISFLPPQWRANFTGKVLKRLMVAFALVMEGLYGLAAQVLRLSVVATSEGAYLRDLVRGWGMTSYDGIAAVATVRFRRFRATEDEITIPAGTEVRTQDGQRFATDEIAYIRPGQNSALVPCTCTRTGIAGNVGAGRIIALGTPIDGVDEVTNPDAATGGIDSEPDGELRARVPIYLAQLHRATVPATTGAIASNKRDFPGVVTFTTEQRAGVPGYFRGILADASGGDNYRVAAWTAAGDLPGVWWAIVDYPQVYGLVLAGWPSIRFGEVTRDATGKEVWEASLSAAAVAEGNYRWYFDGTTGRLYARAEGQDLNGLDLTLIAGVVYRALVELEDNWAAAGVRVDVIVPFVRRVAIALTYALEPGYQQDVVEAALFDAAQAHVGLLGAGAALGLDALYGALNGVPGAGAIEVSSPTQTIQPERNAIVRAENVSIERRG